MTLVLVTGEYRHIERFEMERAALAFANRGIIGDPYGLPTGPTAHVSPGYAVLLGLIFRWFGVGAGAQIVKSVVCSTIDSVIYAMLPRFASGLGLSRRAGVLAGLAGALLPLKLQTETSGDWEASLSALTMLIGLHLVSTHWRTRTTSFRAGLFDGAWWGITLLVIGAALLPYLCLMGVGLVLFRSMFRARAGYAVAAVLTSFALLVPWAVRNNRELGSPIFTRSNSGLELRISNNDAANANEHTNLAHGLYERYHPLQSRAEALEVQRLGEVEYNRRALRAALQWIRCHPGRFVALTAARVRYYWFPVEGPGARGLVFALASLLAGVGCYRFWKRSRATAAIVLVWLAVFPIPNYLVQVNYRYRYPIDWLLLLMGAFAVIDLVGNGRATGLQAAASGTPCESTR
jgi:hypothetical protein